MCIALVVLVPSGRVLAQWEPVIQRIENYNIGHIDLGSIPTEACRVGNTNAPHWAISQFLSPPEHFKLAFDPTQGECSICPAEYGFKIEDVHIVMQTTEPCTLTMSVDVEYTIPPDPDCPNPGPAICESPVYTVVLPMAGVWDISMPTPCDCLPMDNWFLIGIMFYDYGTPSGEVPNLTTDVGPPLYCRNWCNIGSGWNDLLVNLPYWPGQLCFYADATCCHSPIVNVESSTWGAIKQLYRQ
jgi:hypothetical protein